MSNIRMGIRKCETFLMDHQVTLPTFFQKQAELEKAKKEKEL